MRPFRWAWFSLTGALTGTDEGTGGDTGGMRTEEGPRRCSEEAAVCKPRWGASGGTCPAHSLTLGFPASTLGENEFVFKQPNLQHFGKRGQEEKAAHVGRSADPSRRSKIPKKSSGCRISTPCDHVIFMIPKNHMVTNCWTRRFLPPNITRKPISRERQSYICRHCHSWE